MSKHPRKTEMSRVSYSVAIDTVPLPEEPAEFVKLLAQQISDMFNLLVIDMVDSVAQLGEPIFWQKVQATVFGNSTMLPSIRFLFRKNQPSEHNWLQHNLCQCSGNS